jgi:hypothetical protein
MIKRGRLACSREWGSRAVSVSEYLRSQTGDPTKMWVPAAKATRVIAVERVDDLGVEYVARCQSRLALAAPTHST